MSTHSEILDGGQLAPFHFFFLVHSVTAFHFLITSPLAPFPCPSPHIFGMSFDPSPPLTPESQLGGLGSTTICLLGIGEAVKVRHLGVMWA